MNKLVTSVSLAIISLSLSYSYLIPDNFDGSRRAYSGVEQLRHDQNQQVLDKKIKIEPGTPRRLDLLNGANGNNLSFKQIVVLDSQYGPVFIRFLENKNFFNPEIKFNGSDWILYRDYSFPSNFLLKRDGLSCVRLEDFEEPTANYYNLCVNNGELTIHTVGEVDNFS